MPAEAGAGTWTTSMRPFECRGVLAAEVVPAGSPPWLPGGAGGAPAPAAALAEVDGAMCTGTAGAEGTGVTGEGWASVLGPVLADAAWPECRVAIPLPEDASAKNQTPAPAPSTRTKRKPAREGVRKDRWVTGDVAAHAGPVSSLVAAQSRKASVSASSDVMPGQRLRGRPEAIRSAPQPLLTAGRTLRCGRRRRRLATRPR